MAVGAGPRAVGVNRAIDTIYVGNRFDGTVSVVDGRNCNGAASSGCGQTPATVAIGSSSARGLAIGRSVAIAQATDTMYVTSVVDSDVVVINGAACRAGHTKGYRAKPPKMRTGGWPINIALDEAAGTLYVADNVDSNVSFFGLGERTTDVGIRRNWTQERVVAAPGVVPARLLHLAGLRGEDARTGEYPTRANATRGRPKKAVAARVGDPRGG